MTPDWKDIDYLQKGNSRQRHAYATIKELALWSILQVYDPVIVGTIPLAIDIVSSDIDIICEVVLPNQVMFERTIRYNYGHLPNFKLLHTASQGHRAIVCSFCHSGVTLEIFGQALPTVHQAAFRHLLIGHAILQVGGIEWRTAVHRLKKQGVKTGPAFATLLHLSGDPYEALLTLDGKTHADLRELLKKHPLQKLSI